MSALIDIAPDTVITIAIIKHARDWQRLQATHQYHLPIAQLGRISQSPWLAFYMPKWHHEHPHCITHIAQIAALALMTRRDYLPDEHQHPRADNHYVVVTLKALYALDAPLPSQRWRRISIHQTTWAAFHRAHDLSAIRRLTQQLRRITSTHGFLTELDTL